MTKHPHAIALLLLAVLTALVYALGLGHALVFDDARLTDGTILGGYGGLWPLKQRLLSYGSFAWVDAIAPGSLPAQRLVNLALHLGTVAGLHALFARLLARLPGATGVDGALIPAYRHGLWLGCLWFALAPAAVYGVGYLVQRSVVMATCFSAWACWAWVRGLADGRRAWLAAAAVLYVAAVLSKEHAALLAGMALPLYVFVRRPAWKQTLAMLGATLALAAVGVGLLRVFYPNLSDLLGQMFDETSRQLAQQLDAQRPGVGARMYPLSVLNQAALFFHYGLLWFVPLVGWMSIDIRPPFPLGLDSWPHVAGALAYVALLAGSAWAVLRRSDAWGLLGLCLLFPLLLFWSELASVWVQDPFVLYRSYLWAMAVPGVIAVAVGALRPSPRVAYGFGIAAALVLAALAYERLGSLKTPLSAWTDAVEKTDVKGPANAVGRYRAFLNRGSEYLDRFSADLALSDFRAAQALGEPTGAALFNQGVALQVLKRHEDALKTLAQAEAAGYRDGPLYYHRAESLMAQSRWADAADAYAQALRLQLAAPVARQTRARHAEASMRLGRYADAAQDFEALRREEPRQPRHLSGLGMARIGAGQGAAALQAFDEALAQPQDARQTALTHYGRALALAQLRQAGPAREALGQAIQLDPQNPAFRQLQQQWAKDVSLPGR